MKRIREYGSREARKEWREILDTIMSGDSDVLISRHGQKIAALIPANDYYALLDELEELRIGRLAEDIYESYLEGSISVKPYGDVREELLGE
jgi:prevent-host-death family protein